MSKKQKKILARIIVAAVLSVVAILLPIEGVFKFLAFLVPYLVIGYDVIYSAARNIIHGQIFDEQFLMAIATIGAFAIGEYPEAAAVMLFYQIGELFQSIAVGKSRKNIASLMDICPEYAVVIRDNEELTVAPEEVEIGEIIVIKPGEKIPLDGEVVSGSTTVNTAAITGESVPVDKTVGDKVVSGTINLNSVIKIKAQSLYQDSTVAKILELVENSAEKKAKTENFIRRFARYYTPAVTIGALLLAFVPPIFVGNIAQWVNRALIFLVVSCPCALVVSVPLSFFGGIGGASKEGILIKGANYLEQLSTIDTIVFDKTGTLTKGTFDVSAIHPENISAAELLDIAAVAESYSTHPVGESIVRAHKGDIDKSRIGNLEEIAGKGIKANIDNKNFYVGNPTLMEEVGAHWHECELAGTVIHIAQDDKYLGHIVINDEIKSDSREALKSLRELGIKTTVMLTGDSNKVAQSVAEKVGVDKVYSGLMPKDKVEKVEELLASGKKVAFVGDGINDAPVLTRADVGIAMGAMGSDAAIESADVVLMDDKPSKIAMLIKIARKTMRIVKQNIVIALLVKFTILILGALGLANMWFAVFGDVGVMILAILNAMRCMTKIKK